MAILDILEFPDPRLRTVADPVKYFDRSLKRLVSDMYETMYAAPGIGLAATQVDRHIQLIVIDVSDDKDEPLTLINPVISAASGVQTCEEGCLSVPGIYAKVDRADSVTVQAEDVDGQKFELTAGGLLAVCIQHEMDHLQGKVFVDYLSPLKRQRVMKKLEKASRVA